MNDTECEVLVVGAGPAGSAAALRAAHAGRDVLLVDMQDFPRDKTCGDGLTPRAVHALDRLGASDLVATTAGRPEIRGLRLHGFGGSVTAPWPDHPEFPARGTAVARSDLDNALVERAVAAGARLVTGSKAVDVETDLVRGAHRVRAVVLADGSRVRCRYLVLAEGVRSVLARTLGVQWLRGLVHGVAARSYCPSPFGDEPWIHSHLELRDSDGVAQPGYGWIFPLGTTGGHGSAVNLGCGTLSTSRRPAKVNVRRLLSSYAGQCRDGWQLGEPTLVASALLPMGGAVTRVAGVNWAAVGDTAALVNPLNGEGIDYALESGADVVDLLPDADRSPDGLRHLWPDHLRGRYGDAFSLARRAATLLTRPGLLSALGPLGMRGPLAEPLMGTATRLMGNLVTPEDRDLTARAWLAAGRLSGAHDRFWHAESRPLFGAS
ncbi:geranylgeranyl reductase family protein [Corynebacterium sp.]|uniref:geranylgeranyl reductase family protein n=1 Tax=Corynebacterium sp. TaxID=1720 RepID=UPI0025BE61B1|nr:geranylgeranyl reductase family protein [Corynebacterium sp.]